MAVLPGVPMIMGDRQKLPPSEAAPGPTGPLPESTGDFSDNGVLLLAITPPPPRGYRLLLVTTMGLCPRCGVNCCCTPVHDEFCIMIHIHTCVLLLAVKERVCVYTMCVTLFAASLHTHCPP